MLATAGWIVLMAAAVVWEVFCRTHKGWASLRTLASQLWLNPFGRIAYVLLWSFVAWHVFTRYTIPR